MQVQLKRKARGTNQEKERAKERKTRKAQVKKSARSRHKLLDAILHALPHLPYATEKNAHELEPLSRTH